MPPVSPFSWTSDRDYKLHSCAVFALEDWPKVLPKTQGLQPVYLHYRYNIVRVRTMMLLPFQAASMSADIQRWIDRAQLEHFGTLMPEAITAEDYKFINKRCEEMSQKELVPLQKLLGTPAWDDLVRKRNKEANLAVTVMASSSAANTGIDALLASGVTGTWTAFEILARDLWEAALNLHPDTLSNLNGNPRLSKEDKEELRATNSESEADEDSAKKIPISLIKRHGYDLSAKMGTILSERYGWGRLASIRKAYVDAFSKDFGAIDGAIRHKALDALSIVRNLLVHKSGKVDAEYVRRSASLSLSGAKLGERLWLDGDGTVALIRPATLCGGRLVEAVDEWLVKHPNRDRKQKAEDSGA